MLGFQRCDDVALSWRRLNREEQIRGRVRRLRSAMGANVENSHVFSPRERTTALFHLPKAPVLRVPSSESLECIPPCWNYLDWTPHSTSRIGEELRRLEVPSHLCSMCVQLRVKEDYAALSRVRVVDCSAQVTTREQLHPLLFAHGFRKAPLSGVPIQSEG